MDFIVPDWATVQEFQELAVDALFAAAFKDGEKGMGTDDAYTSVDINGSPVTIMIGWFRKIDDVFARAMHFPTMDINVPFSRKAMVVIVELA